VPLRHLLSLFFFFPPPRQTRQNPQAIVLHILEIVHGARNPSITRNSDERRIFQLAEGPENALLVGYMIHPFLLCRDSAHRPAMNQDS